MNGFVSDTGYPLRLSCVSCQNKYDSNNELGTIPYNKRAGINVSSVPVSKLERK